MFSCVCTWCFCWLRRDSSTSWLGGLLIWQRGGVSLVAFCLLRHIHTKKKRQATINGMVMAGIKMSRISFLVFSGGSENNPNGSEKLVLLLLVWQLLLHILLLLGALQGLVLGFLFAWYVLPIGNTIRNQYNILSLHVLITESNNNNINIIYLCVSTKINGNYSTVFLYYLLHGWMSQRSTLTWGSSVKHQGASIWPPGFRQKLWLPQSSGYSWDKRWLWGYWALHGWQWWPDLVMLIVPL